MLRVFIICILSLVLMSTIHIYFFGLRSLQLESLSINLISSVILLFFTLFLLEKLISKHSNEMKKSEKYNEYKNVLETQHDNLVYQLSSIYTHFITGDSKVLELEVVIEQINEQITKDFPKKIYEISQINSVNIFQPIKASISYDEFNSRHFKPVILINIEKYTSKYISMLPKEVVNSLFTIESILQSNQLVVPLDHGIKLDIRNMEVDNEALSVLQDKLRTIGKELVFLRDYLVNQE